MIKAYIELIVRDKDGNIIEYSRQPAKSWVANFARELRGLFSAPGGTALGYSGTVASADVLDETGTSTTVWTEWYGAYSYGGGTPIGFNAGDDDDTYGIIVGKGTTPVSYDDYKLADKISHGTGAGQLDYEPHTIVDVSVDATAGTAIFKLSRSFTNVSGDTVTVAEVGIVARSYWKDSGAVRQDIKYLIARDVLDEPTPVPHLGSLNVTYTVEVSL